MNVRWLSSLLLAATASGFAVPFILPWNDSLPGVVTDFSALNPAISAASVVTVDTNGHFVANGQRVRFLGVNFGGDSLFMPTNKADAVAARLAKFGVNCVRFHHIDAAWAYGGGVLAYNSTSSTNLNASQLEKVHYVISRLKAHGIYANVNLLVGREHRPGDGLGSPVTTMDWKDQHILGYFNDTALALHQAAAHAPVAVTVGDPTAQPTDSFSSVYEPQERLYKWISAYETFSFARQS